MPAPPPVEETVASKLDIITGILTEVGRTDLTAMARIWFDEVYQTVLSFTDWDFITTRATRACVVGTFRYGLPSDFRKLQVFFMDTGSTNSRKMREMALADFVAKYPRLESVPNAVPIEFTIYDNNLLIGPPPDSTYTMNMVYTYNAPALADGDTPVVPERWLNCLRTGLRAATYLHLRETEKAKSQAETFAGYLKKMELDDKDVSGDQVLLQPFLPAGSTYESNYWANPFVTRL